MNKIQFLEKLLSQSSKPIVLDFHFERKCIHSRKMVKPFEDLAQKYEDVFFVKIDKEKNPGLKAKYGIKWYPTFLLFRKGDLNPDPYFTVYGADKIELEKNIQQLLK